MNGLSAHREHLRGQHDELEQLISAEMKRPLPDQGILQKLKRMKLAVKERLD